MADARQDRDVYSPDNKVNKTGGEIKQAVKLEEPKIIRTEWNVFDEEGRDHGGAHASEEPVEGPTPPNHTEQASFPSAVKLNG